MNDSSFGLYIHYPWCWSKCPYCDFNAYSIKAHQSNYETYTDQLLFDLIRDSAHYPFLKEIKSIYLGGGTPSLCPPYLIDKLIKKISTIFKLQDDCEITMEISPKTSYLDLCGFIDAGVNRFSVGLQSFNPLVLKTLGREHHDGESITILESLKKTGIKNINIDLMYGLSCQSIEDVLIDLKKAADFEVEHISWYELAIEPNTIFSKKPELKANADLLELMEEKGQFLLKELGYNHYEVSAYCKNKKSRHNSAYWSYQDYLGIGAGAHSKITLHPFQTIRTHKTRYPKDYLNYPKVIVDKVDRDSTDYLLNRLRLFSPITIKEMKKRLHDRDVEIILKWLYSRTDFDQIILHDDGFELTTRGRQLINDLLLEFELFIDHR